MIYVAVKIAYSHTTFLRVSIQFSIIQSRLIKHSYLIFHIDDLNYISHVGNKHEIGDFENYNHHMYEKDDFSLLKDDMMGSYFKNLFSLKKSIFVRTSNEHWIRNFYLPYLECDKSNEMILFQSEASNPSYIHSNTDTFQLERNSNFLLIHNNGKWKATKTPYISGNIS